MSGRLGLFCYVCFKVCTWLAKYLSQLVSVAMHVCVIVLFLMDLVCHKDQRDCCTNISLSNIVRFVIVHCNCKIQVEDINLCSGYNQCVFSISYCYEVRRLKFGSNQLMAQQLIQEKRKDRFVLCLLVCFAPLLLSLCQESLHHHNITFLLVSAGRCVCNFF